MGEAGAPMKVVVIGAGRIGLAVARMLLASNDFRVTIADGVEEACDRARHLGCAVVQVDAARPSELAALLRGQHLVVAALPAQLCPLVCQAAIEAGIHYVDSAEDTHAVKQVAAGVNTGSIAIPGCGIAPGLVSNIALNLTEGRDGPIDMVVRVGGLPVYPSNRMGYGLTWDIDALFAEYTQDCKAIVDGQIVNIPPLEQHENFVLDGNAYEAFSTSGGLGDLPEDMRAKIRNLSFKTIRYPGHLHLAKFLFEDLGLKRRRDLLRTVLQHGIPEITEDVLVIFITSRWLENGRLVERSYVKRIYHARSDDGAPMSAMVRASSAHVCAMIDLIASGSIADFGLVLPRQVPFAAMAGNRFLAPLLGDGDVASE